MKKIILVTFAIILIISCKSKNVNFNSDEVIIANKALLIAKSNYKEFLLLNNPDNEMMNEFNNVDFFFQEKEKVKNSKLYFNGNKIKIWNKREITLNDKVLYTEVTLVKDFNKIEKAPYNQPEKVRYFYSISNVKFSEDGNYAIVNVSSHSNSSLEPSYESHMYIFKKEENNWVYSHKKLVGTS